MGTSAAPRAGPPRKLWSVESCRTYATLGVVLFHCNRSAATHSGQPVTGPLIAGLDIFFVISGFLVWKITRERAPSPALFVLHRVSRIAPLYAVATLGYAALVTFTGAEAFMRPPSFTAGDIVQSLLFLPHRDSHGSPFPVLLPGWTLVYDVYFFLLFALVLAFPTRRQLAAATVIFSVPALAHFAMHTSSPLLTLATHPRLWDFLGGIWIAEAWRQGVALPKRMAGALALMVLAAYVGLFFAGIDYHGAAALAWIAIALAGLYAAVSLDLHDSRMLSPPFSPQIADASYGIYLFQSFAMVLGCALLPGPFLIKFVAGVALSLLFGKLAYDVIEAPISRAVGAFEHRFGLRPSPVLVGP